MQPQHTINALVAQIKAAGLRPFVAERGTYGFFTNADGSRVVSFGAGGVEGLTFSGCYRSESPSAGSGWRMDRRDCTGLAEMLDAYPPPWATGRAPWVFTTLAQHLRTYQKTSLYTEA